ncbi:hypothetical protein [Henriciella aquimarina]|uniref:hypothetical protein n=1 Tax=Henriciella aquimarina TaxID=545261 RepID=UPI000A053118|nr:hypothetical protein [Henriciella aquimarina]
MSNIERLAEVIGKALYDAEQARVRAAGVRTKTSHIPWEKADNGNADQRAWCLQRASKIADALKACGLEVNPEGTGERAAFLDGARIRQYGRNKALIPQFDLVWPERLEHDAAEKLLEQFTARRASLREEG